MADGIWLRLHLLICYHDIHPWDPIFKKGTLLYEGITWGAYRITNARNNTSHSGPEMFPTSTVPPRLRFLLTHMPSPPLPVLYSIPAKWLIVSWVPPSRTRPLPPAVHCLNMWWWTYASGKPRSLPQFATEIHHTYPAFHLQATVPPCAPETPNLFTTPTWYFILKRLRLPGIYSPFPIMWVPQLRRAYWRKCIGILFSLS